MIDGYEAFELEMQERKTRRNEAAENRRAWDPDRDEEPQDEQQENEE